jgi:hypothetical protein
MGWEPLVERPCHLVRSEKVTPELTTKVNNWAATIPMILGSLVIPPSVLGVREPRPLIPEVGYGEGYWFHRLNQGLGCPTLGAVHFPVPQLSIGQTWLGWEAWG